MKRLLFIPLLAALSLLGACSSETTSELTSWVTLFPYKGASIKMVRVYQSGDTYYQSNTLEFNDTCSGECTVYVLLNGLLLTQQTGTSWSYKLDPELLSRTTQRDSLSFHIARRGQSARYGLPYDRKDTVFIFFGNIPNHDHVTSNATSVFSFVTADLSSDSVHLQWQTGRSGSTYAMFDGHPELGDLSFSAQGGDQTHILVTWPDTLAFDAVDVLYDDYLLNHVTHSGWNCRYYLDDLYRGGVLRLRIIQDGEPRYYTLPTFVSHSKKESHEGVMTVR